jgi:hypothetical protein
MRVNGCVDVGGGQVVGPPALLDHPDDPTGSHLNPSESV